VPIRMEECQHHQQQHSTDELEWTHEREKKSQKTLSQRLQRAIAQ